MTEKRDVSAIVWREDLYPRFEANQAFIQRYAQSLEYLPPIKISQDDILIDGYHRWKAHQLEGEREIAVEIIEVASEKELKRLAYQLNSNHGLQLSNDEKRRYAQEMIGESSAEDLAMLLSVSKRTILRWTETQRKGLREERDRRIVELYLRAWHTQEMVGEIVGEPQVTVHDVLKNIEKRHLSEIDKNFKPPLYNIWNLSKQDSATDSHFGTFPLFFMKSLLHYHTEPLDIVFDPFAGGGTTVDACKAMFRRYYCSDRKVRPGREKDILQHDILTGFPDALPKPAMLFLDPPYWVLAKSEYSEDDNDLGNMSKAQFFDAMAQIADEARRRPIERIAYLIRPIWETGGDDGWSWVDPLFEMYEGLKDDYYIEARYVLPYSTQQYTGLWVERAKKERKCLILNRELMVLRRRENG